MFEHLNAWATKWPNIVSTLSVTCKFNVERLDGHDSRPKIQLVPKIFEPQSRTKKSQMLNWKFNKPPFCGDFSLTKTLCCPFASQLNPGVASIYRVLALISLEARKKCFLKCWWLQATKITGILVVNFEWVYRHSIPISCSQCWKLCIGQFLWVAPRWEADAVSGLSDLRGHELALRYQHLATVWVTWQSAEQTARLYSQGFFMSCSGPCYAEIHKWSVICKSWVLEYRNVQDVKRKVLLTKL